jgi:hypothetical protein
VRRRGGAATSGGVQPGALRPHERLTLARELDATAYASFPLTAGTALLGTLSIGSRTSPEFQPDELTVLGPAADLVIVAAARERDAAVPDAALADRTAAEQRAGHLQIVLVRTGRTEEQAQGWLAAASQRSNRKMRALAEEIVLTGSDRGLRPQRSDGGISACGTTAVSPDAVFAAGTPLNL